jgi:hypothetical protein
VSISNQHRAAQGVHGVGSAEYTEAQYALVVGTFKRLAAHGPVTALALHQATGVPGLTLRQIMSQADGVDFLLGGSGADGYQIANDAAEATRLTQRFGSQVRKMAGRIQRRRRMARGLL